MAKGRKPKKEVIAVIDSLELIKKSSGKLNKGSDGVVRQGTGIYQSRKRKKQLKKKTTRQYLSDYDRAIKLIDVSIMV